MIKINIIVHACITPAESEQSQRRNNIIKPPGVICCVPCTRQRINGNYSHRGGYGDGRYWLGRIYTSTVFKYCYKRTCIIYGIDASDLFSEIALAVRPCFPRLRPLTFKRNFHATNSAWTQPIALVRTHLTERAVRSVPFIRAHVCRPLFTALKERLPLIPATLAYFSVVLRISAIIVGQKRAIAGCMHH